MLSTLRHRATNRARFSRFGTVPFGGLQIVMLIAGLGLVALVWASLSYHLGRRETALREQAHRDVLNLSIALEKHVERLLVGVDQVLRFMVEDFESDPDGFEFDLWLRRATSLEAVANQISMYDASGDLVASRTPPAPGMPHVNVRDRAYFQALSGPSDPGLYVDRTILGRITGRYVLQTARRLSRRDGSFAGVIAISVSPDYLSKQFEAVDVGRQGGVAMFGHDGYIRARFPQVAGMYEQNVTTLSSGRGVFAHLKESPAGTYEARSAFDGVTRIFGYRTVGSLPLIVTVGKSLDEVMAPLQEERLRARLAGIAVTVLVLAVLLILAGGLERRRKAAALLAAANRTLAEKEAAARAAETQAKDANRLLTLAAQIAHLGHWRVDLPENRLSWSDQIFRIYGLDGPEAPTVEAAIAAYHPEDRPLVARCVDEALRLARDFAFSARLIRPDGSVRDVISRGLCEQGPDGAVTAIFGTVMDVTELRSAERAAMASDALYRLLADNSGDMISHMDLTGRRLYVSPAAQDLLGYAPEDLVGTRPQDMVHPDDAPALDAVVENLACGALERTVNLHRLRHRDGRWIWAETSLKLLRDPGGAAAGIITAVRDVTARKQAEQALQDSERRYRLLADNTNDMIALVDMDTTRRYVSPAARKLLGYEPDELIGTKPLDMVHPEDRPEVAAVLRALGDGSRTAAVKRQRYRRKDGSYVCVEVSYQIFHDEAGRPLGCIACTRDVSEQQAQAEALRRSEASYRLLAENTSELIMLGHDDGRRSYISPASMRLLGFTPDELAAMSLRDYVHPEDLPRLFATTSHLGTGVAQVCCVYRALNRFSGWIWVEGVFRRVPGAKPGEPSIVATFRDVTERERQARLLEQAKTDAEAGARVKAEFLANMSHELRTPLTGMLGVHDLLRSDPTLSERQRHLIGLAQESGRALLAIVNDVLDFSKIEAGQFSLEPSPFGLRALLESCRELAAGTARGKPLAFEVELAATVPDWFVGDAARLRQILLNLLTNAAKFTSQGRVVLKARHDAANGRLRFEVSDTGIGIPSDKLPLLFERFSQADASTSRRYGGTGLGLAICKRLVGLMGGIIGVESEPGQGSTFWFEVPLATAEGSMGQEATPGLLAARAGRALRLLVAEDNAINQEILRSILGQKGHAVTLVGDGAAAIAAVTAGARFDVVLMDVQMPGLDGVEATRAIRDWERAQTRQPTPIIALTANALAEEVARCRQAGMDAHVAKPVEWDVLFSAMERLAGGAAAAPAGSGADSLPERAPAARVFDETVLEELAEILGAERLGTMLAAFVDETGRRVGVMAEAPAAEVARHAHALVSLAGQLGFLELSDFCRALEQRVQAGAPLDRLPLLREVAARALSAAAAAIGRDAGAEPRRATGDS